MRLGDALVHPLRQLDAARGADRPAGHFADTGGSLDRGPLGVTKRGLAQLGVDGQPPIVDSSLAAYSASASAVSGGRPWEAGASRPRRRAVAREFVDSARSSQNVPSACGMDRSRISSAPRRSLASVVPSMRLATSKLPASAAARACVAVQYQRARVEHGRESGGPARCARSRHCARRAARPEGGFASTHIRSVGQRLPLEPRLDGAVVARVADDEDFGGRVGGVTVDAVLATGRSATVFQCRSKRFSCVRCWLQGAGKKAHARYGVARAPRVARAMREVSGAVRVALAGRGFHRLAAFAGAVGAPTLPP